LSLSANVKGDAAHHVIGALTAGVQVGDCPSSPIAATRTQGSSPSSC